MSGRAVRMWLPRLLLVPMVVACRFERRMEPESAASSQEDASVAEGVEAAAAEPGVGPVEIVELFRRSVAVGDLSLALALLDREATLVDELVGQAFEAGTRGELLLELRRRHATGLSFESLEAPSAISVGESALVVTRLSLVQQEEGGGWQTVGRAYETVYLLASPEGWRIRHLHRSLLPEP